MRFSSPRLSSWLDGAVAANTALAPVPEDGDVDAVGAGASGGGPSVAEAGGDACDRDQAAVAVVSEEDVRVVEASEGTACDDEGVDDNADEGDAGVQGRAVDNDDASSVWSEILSTPRRVVGTAGAVLHGLASGANGLVSTPRAWLGGVGALARISPRGRNRRRSRDANSPAGSARSSPPTAMGAFTNEGADTHPLAGARAAQEPQRAFCRICLEEDASSALEMPCACRGSYAQVHRQCLLRWIETRKSNTCEVCGQEYAAHCQVKDIDKPPGALQFFREDDATDPMRSTILRLVRVEPAAAQSASDEPQTRWQCLMAHAQRLARASPRDSAIILGLLVLLVLVCTLVLPSVERQGHRRLLLHEPCRCKACRCAS